METISERRRRKLAALARQHGLTAIAERSGLSPASLDQVIKGTLMKPKADGTRSAKALGNASARAIENGLGLGTGWFDAEDAIAPPSDELMDALNVVAGAIRAADHLTRVSLKPLLSLLADPNEDATEITNRVHSLLTNPSESSRALEGARIRVNFGKPPGFNEQQQHHSVQAEGRTHKKR